ncbi:MAG: hypothetical protein WBQ25_08510 [Nitrososphaeraceae archaeon]
MDSFTPHSLFAGMQRRPMLAKTRQGAYKHRHSLFAGIAAGMQRQAIPINISTVTAI